MNEIGPRMRIELMKVEEELFTGRGKSHNTKLDILTPPWKN